MKSRFIHVYLMAMEESEVPPEAAWTMTTGEATPVYEHAPEDESSQKTNDSKNKGKADDDRSGATAMTQHMLLPPVEVYATRDMSYLAGYARAGEKHA